MARFRMILIVVAALLVALPAVALAAGGQVFQVTITNLTKGQPLTPPLVVSHNNDFKLFTLGDLDHPAGDGLVALAEGGDTSTLIGELMTDDNVYDYMVGGGLLLPGHSMTVEINVKNRYRNISLASMLAATNDAFVGVNGVSAPWFGKKALTAIAYDAGSEANTELCTDVPAQPCDENNNPNNRVTEGAEGFVYVHNGIQGGGDLNAADKDWSNPVAKVVITRMR